MYQLEEEIVDVKVECPVGAFLAAEFLVKLIDSLLYHLSIVLNN